MIGLPGFHTLAMFSKLTVVSRQRGQLFMMGFEGTVVNDQIKSLIEEYHVGSVLLTEKNLKCAFKMNHLFPASRTLI